MRSISERQARLWCLILGATGGLISGLNLLTSDKAALGLTGIIVSTLLAGLAWLYWRGWEPARLIAVALFTVAAAASLTIESLQLGVTIVAVFALLLAEPWWVVGVSLLTAAGIVGRGLATNGSLADLSLADIPVIILIVAIMAITRFALEAERRRSQELAAQARAAQVDSEAQAARLEHQKIELTAQNEQQRQLLDLVAALETPAVMIAEGVALAPLSGQIDSRRAAHLTGRLLGAVGEQRLRLVVLDLSGVPTVDSSVAQSLLRMIQAIQLLGCEVNVTGISAPMAATMARLGLGLAGVKTWRSPHEALEANRRSMQRTLDILE